MCAPYRPRLLGAPVDAGQQDVCAGDHGPQEEARWGHSRRGLPRLPALHCQRWRRCTCQDLCLTAAMSFGWDAAEADEVKWRLFFRLDISEKRLLLFPFMSVSVIVELMWLMVCFFFCFQSPAKAAGPKETEDYSGDTKIHTGRHTHTHTQSPAPHWLGVCHRT